MASSTSCLSLGIPEETSPPSQRALTQGTMWREGGPVRMVIPSLRLLLAPWAEVFDELDVISLVSGSQQAPT